MQLKAAHLSQTTQRKTSHATGAIDCNSHNLHNLSITNCNLQRNLFHNLFHILTCQCLVSTAYLVGINQIDYSHNKVIDTF